MDDSEIDDMRPFDQLTDAEQKQLIEWINMAFFPTRDGGLCLESIVQECFFLTDRPSTLWPGTGLKGIWQPSHEAILEAMRQVGWIKQRDVVQWSGSRVPFVTFYSVKVYYYVLPKLATPKGKMMRDFYDWSQWINCWEAQTIVARKSGYKWKEM